MTEITRVPLQPVAKGSVGKIWLGVIAAAVAAAALASGGKPPLVDVQTLSPGVGPSPHADDFVMIRYQGQLANGTVFDQSDRAVMQLNHVIPGFTKAVMQMQPGGRYKVHIPAALAYGDHAVGPIPANSDLTFTIDLIEFKTAQEVEQQQMMMERMRQMQMQQGGAGAPGGSAPQGAQ